MNSKFNNNNKKMIFNNNNKKMIFNNNNNKILNVKDRKYNYKN